MSRRMVKLTLNAEPDLIAEAKLLAARRNISLSTLFSRLLKTLARTEPTKGDALGPLTRNVSGLVRLPSDEKDILAEALSRKYGLNG